MTGTNHLNAQLRQLVKTNTQLTPLPDKPTPERPTPQDERKPRKE